MSDVPPPAQLWQLVRGMIATQAVYVTYALGIADELARGPQPAAELADRTGADAAALRRFLRVLASEGVFTEDDGVFRNTPASELLRRRAPGEWELISFFGTVWYRMFADALECARTGRPSFPRIFGDDWWRWLARNPQEGELFARAMGGGAADRAEVLAELNWRGDETVVDVGGGNGALLIELLRRRPGLRGVVFDLPEVAGEAEVRVAEAGLADRCEVVAGSVFDGVPEEGDVYLLSAVLHDWGDDEASAILRNVRRAASASSRVVIVDAVLPAGTAPGGDYWMDLLMLVLLGGKERTETEWRALLAGADFRLERVRGDRLLEAVPT